ncbi:Lipase maturation factor [endosymbiont of Ridgeia piscesae]|jgi:hypothetical protein|uniref:Lipase maturation factor n=2 Tax=endosymbiont of Ridgeia piscesae TaxID=54398 RepID=A0A0T5YST6_9GAMM|nr:Lipase maturation factor [endosymbiont of Ridgeia piscesae]KRT59949.1 Lipase maturation factor [endosymbiont of Ridgeia piscesae]
MNAPMQRIFQVDDDYRLISRLFIKLLALIYLAAFYSLSGQIVGLVGSNGILPFQELLRNSFAAQGYAAWWQIPNIFWLSSHDGALQAASWAGSLCALLLLAGIRPRAMLVLLFVIYLSLTQAGQFFLNFQWDYLLLEVGFLSIFLVDRPTRLVIFLFHWLLFRLRLLSGLSKILSGDPSWGSLTTLEYYFETQPLPHIGAWYAHQLPEGLLMTATALVLFSELLLPFFIFLPRPFRIFAALSTILVQIGIIATSNHNFINLLTILLCLFLLDDHFVRRLLPAKWRTASPPLPQHSGHSRFVPLISGLTAGFILLVSLSLGYQMISGRSLPEPLASIALTGHQFGLGNVYHVFPTMQRERHELRIEGSQDGIEWHAYRFRYKPGPLDRQPAFIIPHQPRLDWMVWFVPTQAPEMLYWFDRLMLRLWKNTPEVTGLLAHNPFSDRPPRYLRVLVYRYRFTSGQERLESGNWWRADYLGQFPNTPPRRP